MSYHLRKATPEDATALAALSIEVWLGTYLPSGVPSSFAAYALEAFSPDALRALLTDDTHSVIVAESTDPQVSAELRGPLGYIRLDHASAVPIAAPNAETPRGDRDTPTCEITTLYIQPRHHGTGIGKALLDAGLAQAHARGARDCWLRCSVENPRAMGFYTAHQFTDHGRADFELDGKRYENRLLRRDTET